MGVFAFILGVALVVCILIIRSCFEERETFYQDARQKARNEAIEYIEQEKGQEIIQIRALRFEVSALNKEVSAKKKILADLEKEINSLEEEKKPNRTRFTEFFEAVKKQYGDDSFSPEWHADAFVSLFIFYANHYDEIEKKLSSFVPSNFKESKTDIVNHFITSHQNQPEITNIRFDVSATAIGSRENYTTTLFHCSCKDFEIRKRPCKHMIALSRELDISWIFGLYVRSEIVRTLKFAALTNSLKVVPSNQPTEISKTTQGGKQPEPQHRVKYSLRADDVPPPLSTDILRLLLQLDK